MNSYRGLRTSSTGWPESDQTIPLVHEVPSFGLCHRWLEPANLTSASAATGQKGPYPGSRSTRVAEPITRLRRRAGKVGVAGSRRVCRRRRRSRTPRFGEVSPEGVPRQAGVLSAQRGEACGGQPAPLELGQGVRLLDPTESTPTADPVVDLKRELTVHVRRALPPSGLLGRDRVLPRRAQLGDDGQPSRRPSRPRLIHRSTARQGSGPDARPTSWACQQGAAPLACRHRSPCRSSCATNRA